MPMTFQEAEETYRDLKAQHDSGKMSDSTFEAEVGKLRMQDAQGRWWQVGVQTGEWYMHDGKRWNKAKPPAETPIRLPTDQKQRPLTRQELRAIIEQAAHKKQTRLDLSYKGISKLLDEIGGLACLQFLDLSYNELEELPKSIGNLTELTSLSLHTVVSHEITGQMLNYLVCSAYDKNAERFDST